MARFLLKLTVGILVGLLISRKELEKIYRDWKGDK
jgi:uncharacterized protein YneF (UPF0154 family)